MARKPLTDNRLPAMIDDPAAYDMVLGWLRDSKMDTAGKATKQAILEYIQYLEEKVGLTDREGRYDGRR